MKIGIISDSHDDLENVMKSITIFLQNNVDYVIHAGDFVFPGIVQEFKKITEKGIKFIGVLGNNDGEILGLRKSFEDINGVLGSHVWEGKIDGKSFCVYHGTEKNILDCLINSKKFDGVISGHTHQQLIKKIQNTLHLNPGTSHRIVKNSVNGFFDKGVPSVMIFDTSTMKAKFIAI